MRRSLAILLSALCTLVARDVAPFVTPSKPVVSVVRPRGPGDLIVLSTDPVMGVDTARVTIVEFSDLQCPFCARAGKTLLDLRAQYGDDLRIVWKDMPLVFHPQARPAARAGRVAFLASGNAAFWKLQEQIFAEQYALSTKLPGWSDAVGADANAMSRFGTLADQLIDDSVKLAEELYVNGTPTFFIDGELLNGAQPFDAFQKVIDAHVIEARALLSSGVPPRGLYLAMLARHAPKVRPPKE